MSNACIVSLYRVCDIILSSQPKTNVSCNHSEPLPSALYVFMNCFSFTIFFMLFFFAAVSSFSYMRIVFLIIIIPLIASLHSQLLVLCNAAAFFCRSLFSFNFRETWNVTQKHHARLHDIVWQHFGSLAFNSRLIGCKWLEGHLLCSPTHA